MRDIIIKYRSSVNDTSALANDGLTFGPGTGIYNDPFFKTSQTQSYNYDLIKTNNAVSSARLPNLQIWDTDSTAITNISLTKANTFIEPEIIPQSGCKPPGAKVELEEYQKQAVEEIITSLEKKERVGLFFVDMLMGTGKTAIMAELIAKLCLKETSKDTAAKVMTISKQEDAKEFQRIQKDVHKLGSDFFAKSDTANLYHSVSNVKINNQRTNNLVGQTPRLYTLNNEGDSCKYEDMLSGYGEYKKMQTRMFDKYVNYLSGSGDIAPVILVIDEPQKLLKKSQESNWNFLNFLKKRNKEGGEHTEHEGPYCVHECDIECESSETVVVQSSSCAQWTLPKDDDRYFNEPPPPAAATGTQSGKRKPDKEKDKEKTSSSKRKKPSRGSSTFSAAGSSTDPMDIDAGDGEPMQIDNVGANAIAEQKDDEGDDMTVQDGIEHIIQRSQKTSFFIRILKLKILPLSLRPTVLFKCSEFFKTFPNLPQTAEEFKDRFHSQVMIPYMSLLKSSMKKVPNLRPLCRGKQHGVVAIAGKFGVKELEVHLDDLASDRQQVFFIVNKDPPFQELATLYKKVNKANNADEGEKQLFRDNLIKYQKSLTERTTPVIALYHPNKERSAEMGLILDLFGTGTSTRDDDIPFVQQVHRDDGYEFKHCIDWLIIDKSSVGIDLFNVSRILYYGTPKDVKESAIQLISRAIRYCSVYPSNMSECEPTNSALAPKIERREGIHSVFEPIEVVLIDCHTVLEKAMKPTTIQENMTLRVTESDRIFEAIDVETNLETSIKKATKASSLDDFCIDLHAEQHNSSSLPTPVDVWKRSLNYEQFMKWRDDDEVVYDTYTKEVSVYRNKKEVATYKHTQTFQTSDPIFLMFQNKEDKKIRFTVPKGATPLSIYTVEIPHPTEDKQSFVLCLNNYKDATEAPAFDIAGEIKQSIDNWKGISRVFHDSAKQGTHLPPRASEKHAQTLIEFIESRQEARAAQLRNENYVFKTMGDSEKKMVAQEVVANILRMIPVGSMGAVSFFRMFGKFHDGRSKKLELYDAFANYILCNELINEAMLLNPADIRYIVDRLIDTPELFETVFKGLGLDGCNVYKRASLASVASVGQYILNIRGEVVEVNKYSREFTLVTFDAKTKKKTASDTYIIAQSAGPKIICNGTKFYKTNLPREWTLCGAFCIDAAFQYKGSKLTLW